MSTTNSTTTGNETTAPPPTSMELPSANMSTTNLGNTTTANATTSKVSEFPSNQSTSASNVDIDEIHEIETISKCYPISCPTLLNSMSTTRVRMTTAVITMIVLQSDNKKPLIKQRKDPLDIKAAQFPIDNEYESGQHGSH